MKKMGLTIGLISAALIGAGFVTYNYILSPRTKRKMMSLEEDMCEDFENMM